VHSDYEEDTRAPQWRYLHQRWNRSRFSWPGPTGNPSVKPAAWPANSVGSWPASWLAKLHLDQILPCQTGKTAVYTTARLHCVDKCRLSLHDHILIKWKNRRLYKKPFSGGVLEKVSICILSRWPVTHRSSNVDPTRPVNRPDRQPAPVDWPVSISDLHHLSTVNNTNNNKEE